MITTSGLSDLGVLLHDKENESEKSI
jgi:hypothetical protein